LKEYYRRDIGHRVKSFVSFEGFITETAKLLKCWVFKNNSSSDRPLVVRVHPPDQLAAATLVVSFMSSLTFWAVNTFNKMRVIAVVILTRPTLPANCRRQDTTEVAQFSNASAAPLVCAICSTPMKENFLGTSQDESEVQNSSLLKAANPTDDYAANSELPMVWQHLTRMGKSPMSCTPT